MGRQATNDEGSNACLRFMLQAVSCMPLSAAGGSRRGFRAWGFTLLQGGVSVPLGCILS